MAKQRHGVDWVSATAPNLAEHAVVNAALAALSEAPQASEEGSSAAMSTSLTPMYSMAISLADPFA